MKNISMQKLLILLFLIGTSPFIASAMTPDGVLQKQIEDKSRENTRLLVQAIGLSSEIIKVSRLTLTQKLDSLQHSIESNEIDYTSTLECYKEALESANDLLSHTNQLKILLNDYKPLNGHKVSLKN